MKERNRGTKFERSAIYMVAAASARSLTLLSECLNQLDIVLAYFNIAIERIVLNTQADPIPSNQVALVNAYSRQTARFVVKTSQPRLFRVRDHHTQANLPILEILRRPVGADHPQNRGITVI